MMPGLQEFIHKFEEGVGAVYIKRFFLFLVFAGLVAAYDVRKFKSFASSEAMDSAQIARNLAHGEGFTTKFIRPLQIKLMQMKAGGSKAYNPLTNNLPDISNAPVYPLLEAGVLRVTPKAAVEQNGFQRYRPEVWIALLNQALFAFLLWSVFVLGRKIFDASVGATTAAVVALTEVFWRFTVSGLPTILLMIITVWVFWCLADLEFKSREAKAPERRYTIVSILLGALLAIGALTRYSYAWMILPIVGFAAAFMGARRGRVIAITIVMLIAALAPWCFRNYQICGRPFGIAGFAPVELTTFLPENHLQRSMPQNLAFDLNRVDMGQYVKKLLVGAGAVFQKDLPVLGGSWVTALFLVGLLAPFQNPGLGRLRLFLVISILLLIAVQSIGKTAISDQSPEINSENLLILTAPLVFMFGVALFYAFLDQALFEFPRYRGAAVSAFVAVVSIPLAISFLPPRTIPVAYPPYWPPHVSLVASWMNPDELMMSDMPWAVAWYGDRKCAWITLDAGNGAPYDFYAINDYLRPIKGLMLTPITMNARFLDDFLKGNEAAWSRFALDTMVRTNIPGGFPLVSAPTGFLPDFLVLMDRKRW
jgi:hypothetical protein